LACDFIIDNASPTTAVTERDGKVTVLYNEKFFNSVSLDNAAKFLEHEVQHIVRECFLRRGDRDMGVWNVAQDLLINDSIKGFPYSVTVDGKEMAFMFIKDFSKYGVSNKQSSEQVYDLLYKNKDKLGLGESNQWHYVNTPNGKRYSPCNEKRKLTEKQRGVLRERIRKTADNCGSSPGFIRSAIDTYDKDRVRWKSVIQNFCYSASIPKKKPTWKRPNRRFDKMKGRNRDYRPEIVLAIDTSASLSDNVLSSVLAEVHKIWKELHSEILVIECDYIIQKVYKYTKQIERHTFSGGGGTSFRPPFDYLSKHNISPDGLIYFTDLYGDFPSKPKYPVLWISTSGEKDAPFGKVLHIEMDNKLGV
jgi:predicted metal-dependent peptidase